MPSMSWGFCGQSGPTVDGADPAPVRLDTARIRPGTLRARAGDAVRRHWQGDLE